MSLSLTGPSGRVVLVGGRCRPPGAEEVASRRAGRMGDAISYEGGSVLTAGGCGLLQGEPGAESRCYGRDLFEQAPAGRPQTPVAAGSDRCRQGLHVPDHPVVGASARPRRARPVVGVVVGELGDSDDGALHKAVRAGQRAGDERQMAGCGVDGDRGVDEEGAPVI